MPHRIEDSAPDPAAEAPDWVRSEPIGPSGHHVIFEQYDRTLPRSDEYGDYNFMGASVAHAFEGDLNERNSGFHRATVEGLKASGRSARYDATFPFKNSEDYFEWIDLLTAIDRANGQFTMIEIGAGYGRWIANAAAALKRHKSKRLQQKLIGIESDQARFDLMVQNCANNQIRESDRELIRAACTLDGKAALMHVNDGYGNAVWRDPAIEAHFVNKESGQMQFSNLMGQKYSIQKVPGIHLGSLLTEPIDYIDMDIQGGELEVIFSCIEAMDKTVKMIHVGTHSPEIDGRLPHIFHLHGWRPRRIFSGGTVNQTPYGSFSFIDGIQSWENPRFT